MAKTFLRSTKPDHVEIFPRTSSSMQAQNGADWSANISGHCLPVSAGTLWEQSYLDTRCLGGFKVRVFTDFMVSKFSPNPPWEQNL